MECTLISGSGTYRGKQGLEYFNGVSAQTTGAGKLCLHVVTIPPGGRAKPHLHENHESAVYVISGEAGMWHGEDLRQHMWMRAGDFAHIPANVPHLPYNASDTVPCVGLIAHRPQRAGERHLAGDRRPRRGRALTRFPARSLEAARRSALY
jgi:uncharacterized RmlC-like cupin family protein